MTEYRILQRWGKGREKQLFFFDDDRPPDGDVATIARQLAADPRVEPGVSFVAQRRDGSDADWNDIPLD